MPSTVQHAHVCIMVLLFGYIDFFNMVDLSIYVQGYFPTTGEIM